MREASDGDWAYNVLKFFFLGNHEWLIWVLYGLRRCLVFDALCDDF